MKVMKAKHVLMVAALTMIVGIFAADSEPNTCSHTCGNKTIEYPFAIDVNNNASSDCFSDRSLIQLNCIESKLYVGNMPVLNISISTAQIDVLFFVSQYCGTGDGNYTKNTPSFHSGSYTISSKENKFLTIGNNSFGYLNS
jgi:hypothetical protein